MSLAFVDEELAKLEHAGRLRVLRHIDGTQGREVSVDGRRAINFSANNYLGLAGDGEVMRALAQCADEGAGSGGSRLIVGNLLAHRELEAALARWYGAEAAVLFNSGYQANVGVLQALAGRGDAVFSDELNHASIIDGCRLSRADVHVYPHRDVEALERSLRRVRARRRFVVTDALFSMDGDVAPVRDLADVCARHEAALIVDEAHAVGVVGPAGRGVAAAAGVVPDVVVGTLGKAFGTFGAFALARAAVARWLENRARSFVFTTALPPPVVRASARALAVVAGPRGDGLRAALQNNIERLRGLLADRGVAVEPTEMTHIVPFVVGAEADAMRAAAHLLERGLYAQGIRPPTVPPGTSRLRIALMATHTEEDLVRLADGLADVARWVGGGR